MSSVNAMTSNSTHSAAISSSSSRVNTLPVGLCGELSTRPRVRGPNAARSSSGSIDQSGSWSVTYRGTAPDRIASGP